MTSENFNVNYEKKKISSKVGRSGLILTAIGLLVSILAYFVDPVRSGFNNVILLMFVISIGLGSLFLVAVEYIGGAVWSVPFRRVIEFFAAAVIIVPIIAAPMFFNLESIFHWAGHHGADDPILHHKAPYLNIPFFSIRELAFFAIWILFFFILTRNSLKQDKNKDQKLTKRNIRFSALFMPFLAITITFASIDWMMSLEPHWFSTMFGVYYFSGSILCALAAGTIAIVKLNENGYLLKGLRSDHYYSLGALLFAFVNFWAYIAFSQYMLIWYANLPEETFWYLSRWEGLWAWVSIALIIIHFVVPYFGLLSQPSKMNPKRLVVMSAWIIFAHILDLYWIIMPQYSLEVPVFSWIELGFLLLAVGLIILVFSFNAGRKNHVAVGDPKLKRALLFRL